jgi:hypothetical protein
MPHGPIPYISYTYCDFRNASFDLLYDVLHRHVGLILIFLKDPLPVFTEPHG